MKRQGKVVWCAMTWSTVTVSISKLIHFQPQHIPKCFIPLLSNVNNFYLFKKWHIVICNSFLFLNFLLKSCFISHCSLHLNWYKQLPPHQPSSSLFLEVNNKLKNAVCPLMRKCKGLHLEDGSENLKEQLYLWL